MLWASRTCDPSAARRGNVLTASWAVVGRVQKVESETKRRERNQLISDLCGGWENGALGPEQVSSSLSLGVCVHVCACVCAYVHGI